MMKLWQRIPATSPMRKKIRNEIIEQKNKVYIDGFGYVAPSKTQTIIVDSNGDINKMVGIME